MTTYRTFAGWNARGRRVKSGEHAERYLIDPETKIGYPAYREDQTRDTVSEQQNTTDWPTVDAETALANRQVRTHNRRARRPTIRIHPDGTVWVGDDAQLNRAMTQIGWEWGEDYLWRRTLTRPSLSADGLADTLRATDQYLVIDERENT